MNISYVIMICILYVILGAIFFRFLYKNSKNFCPAYKGFVFGMIFYYVIIPVIVLLFANDLNLVEIAKGKYNTNSIQRFVIDGEIGKKIYSIIMVLVCFIFFNIFYKLGEKIKIKKFNSDWTLKVIKFFTYFTFLVGGISLIVVFSSFGGIKESLSYAEQLRGFDSDLGEVNSKIIGIFILLARLIIVSPFLLVYLFKNDELKNKVKKVTYVFMLVVSFIMSILYFLFNAGRAPLLFFGLCFFYIIISNFKKIKRPWLVILVLCVLGLPLLDILDSLFYYFNTGTFNFKEVNYLKFIFQFTFPYKNTLIITDLVNNYGLRFGKDFIFGLLDVLPKVSFEASYVNTSEYIVGSNWKSLGGIPNDFITFAYIQFSVIGVILLASIIGLVLKVLDRKLEKFDNNSSKNLISAAMSIYTFSLIPYADFVSLIKSGFILIILSIIIFFSDRK